MSGTLLVLQHIACEPPAAFEDELRDRGHELVRVELDEGDRLPDWRDFDATVVMGGPMGAYDEDAHPWLAEEKRAIRAAAHAGHPIWGVCLGAQLLAGALGAAVYPGSEAEVGLLAVELTAAAAEDPVFGAAPASFPTLQWHGDTFDLPPGATLLASSSAYRNQAFVFERAYGLQFHLEVSPELATEWGRCRRTRRASRRSAGSARPAGRRGERARRRHAAARARPVRALARAGSRCPRQDHGVEEGLWKQPRSRRPSRSSGRSASSSTRRPSTRRPGFATRR